MILYLYNYIDWKMLKIPTIFMRKLFESLTFFFGLISLKRMKIIKIYLYLSLLNLFSGFNWVQRKYVAKL